MWIGHCNIDREYKITYVLSFIIRILNNDKEKKSDQKYPIMFFILPEKRKL